MEISNIEFKSCASLVLSQGRNVTVTNITTEHGGINVTIDCKLNINNYTVFMHLYDLNITSNSTGIDYRTLGCDQDCPFNAILRLQNSKFSMAKIIVNAECTKINVQNIKLQQILLHQWLNSFFCDVFTIFNQRLWRWASVIYIIFENNTTLGSLLKIYDNSDTTIEGHILQKANKNCFAAAHFTSFQSLKMFSQSKLEFYDNTGIQHCLLCFYYKDTWSIEGDQQSNVSILFRNNVLNHGGSVMIFDTPTKFENQVSNILH